jgi:DNA-binding CsgD family transcriptional regulator
MSVRANERFEALTEKEKQTLRLMARGHDAKSTARSLGLSVHTINERLRDARRKMAVSSSREAARLLLDAESGGASATPDLSADRLFGEDAGTAAGDQDRASPGDVRRPDRRPLIVSGVFLMILALGLSALLVSAQVATPTEAAPQSTAPASEAAEAARAFLVLLDGRRWDDSYRATTGSFREMNSAQVWAAASEQARTPLGAMVSRRFVSEENVPTPPDGYQMVKFQTRFANRATMAQETVTQRREDGGWRVAGIMID